MVLLDDVVQVFRLTQLDGQAAVGHQALHGGGIGAALVDGDLLLTVHGIDDPVAFVEMEHTFHQTMARAGSADHLVQTFTADDEHSFLTEPAYATLMAALLGWSAGGAKPTPGQIAQQCPVFEARFGAGCRFRPDYAPPPLGSRVPPR